MSKEQEREGRGREGKDGREGRVRERGREDRKCCDSFILRVVDV